MTGVLDAEAPRPWIPASAGMEAVGVGFIRGVQGERPHTPHTSGFLPAQE